MARRALPLLLSLALLLSGGAFFAAQAQEQARGPVLYTGRIAATTRVFAEIQDTKGSNVLCYIPKGRRVDIYEMTPCFAYITCETEHISGYVFRQKMENVEPVDPASTPPYALEFNHFIGEVAAQDAPVTARPGGGDTLITLHAGARVSLIGFENGFGKLIYHRQYAYIDSRLLGEMAQVYDSPETAGNDAPIASYTSFYKITDDERNLNRMANIALACRRLGLRAIAPGDQMNFNADVGPYKASVGYLQAGMLTEEGLGLGYGGGTCQVSSTLYDVLLQLQGITVLQRRAHGANGASYLPIGLDAAVGNSALNLRFRNDYAFPIRIDGTAQDGALTIAIYRADAE